MSRYKRKSRCIHMKRLSIKDIQKRIKDGNFTDEEFAQWREDERKGVMKLMDSFDREVEKKEQLKRNYEQMCLYEKTYERQGYSLIAGIDEAGRGPLAGPVVAASVILPTNTPLYGLTDSKQLNEQERNYFYHKIKEVAISYHIQMISNEEVDHINIYEATKKAMTGAVKSMDIQPDYLLVDAVPLPLEIPTTTLTKGDQKSISIAAASVLAKVYRDSYMKSIAEEYPQYHFDSHKGYGTKTHIEAIQTYGVTPYHRKTFTPVKRAITNRR